MRSNSSHPEESDSTPSQHFRAWRPRFGLPPLGRAFSAAVISLLVIFAFFWFVVRVEVPTNHILVLVNKTGSLLPVDLRSDFGDQVVLYPELVSKIAKESKLTENDVKDDYKGIRLDVLAEGRHWFNPFSYERLVFPATLIKQNEIGVLTRKYGRPLPFPKTVATLPDERGPVAEVLTPGRHNINPLAYEVQKFPAIQIPEGHVGVVTLLSGKDPGRKNTYVVEPGEKGVQRATLPPGLEYINPYLKQIDIVDVRSQKWDMIGDDAIHFPSSDSFTITIEGTIEWAIRPDHVAEVTVAYGDKRDILDKIILPNVRSLARIQGSKLQAREFISGKSRTVFQDRLLAELKSECWQQGIDIKSALVRDIKPPAEIAALISQREQADQEIQRYTNQIEEAKAEALLVEQQEMQEQNRGVGEAKTKVVTLTKEADQRKNVAVTKANRENSVATLNLEAAAKEAAAIRSRGEAEAKVVLYGYQAKAEPLRGAVAAFGDGTSYAQQFFFQKVAPSIQFILTNTEGPFADIFKSFQTSDTPSKGGKR
ncbi:MAG TPA: SPFH domain-containing protein [Phycisphaerae bacterium]|nr:SPFH domain-containing protein [Phycisphaerae bacterium]